MLCGSAHDEHGEFVEQVHRYGNHHEGEYVGGWCYHGGNGHDGHNGMTAIASHVFCLQKSQLSEEPAEYWHLEHKSEGECHCKERGDVGIKCDGVLYRFVYLVVSEEVDYEREHYKVAEEYTDKEHEIASSAYPDDITSLVGIECGRDKPEELI